MNQPGQALNPETPVDHLPTRDGYDRWAEIYDSEDNPLVAVEEPLVRHLLGDVRDQAVLDLGCGTGRHAVWLAAARGACTGAGLLAGDAGAARAKAVDVDVVFRVHDLTEPLPFPPRSFERVVCGLVVDHIADLGSLFREMHRVCRPTGAVVVSMMHPAMMLQGVQARFRDPVSGREVRPASLAHQLSDYVLAAARAGFAFDHLSEHAVDQALADRMERARKYLGWPLLFLMRLLPAGRTTC